MICMCMCAFINEAIYVGSLFLFGSMLKLNCMVSSICFSENNIFRVILMCANVWNVFIGTLDFYMFLLICIYNYAISCFYTYLFLCVYACTVLLLYRSFYMWCYKYIYVCVYAYMYVWLHVYIYFEIFLFIMICANV